MHRPRYKGSRDKDRIAQGGESVCARVVCVREREREEVVCLCVCIMT